MKRKSVELLPITIDEFDLDIVGISELIMHRFSAETKAGIEDDQTGKAKRVKAPRDPKAECEAALYRNEKGKYAIPSAAFKMAAVEACATVDGITMKTAKGAFYVMGDFVELTNYTEPRMRSDIVRIGRFGSKTAIPRYRPSFEKWGCKLRIRYRTDLMNPEQIINLMNSAGFSIGVLEWRPQKNGTFGMFGVSDANVGNGRKTRKKAQR